ncbi:hypothetical protein [Azonexus sp.]|uniref:hypothetical protein n=1 Tax=Azonexus sp. TaxID=1872668 RepID=UPI0039E6EA46
MYRVVTTYRNGSPRPVVERGPWHVAQKTADDWAQILRALGYAVHVEAQNGMIDAGGEAGGNDDLMAALASMA